MKKIFDAPKANVVMINAVDVIATSEGGSGTPSAPVIPSIPGGLPIVP